MSPQRLDLRYLITWEGRWYVGSGYQSATADRLQRRFRRGDRELPFVPGSQIKGVLRHRCERLALSLGSEVIDPHVGAERGDRGLVAHFRPLATSDLLIDRLFGSRYQGECLFVTNAVPTTGVSANATGVASRTTIDRTTGTVMDQHLFSTELVDAHVSLNGEVRARHPGGVLTQDNDGFPYEYALLVAGILSLDTLGGDNSVGLGQCEVRIESLRWNGQDTSPALAVQSFKEEVDWAVMVDLLREEKTH